MTGAKRLLRLIRDLSKTPALKSLTKFKTQLFTRYLLPTNLFISTVGSTVSDVTCQRLEIATKLNVFDEKTCVPCKIDWGRAARFGTSGFLLGPLCHYWYIALDVCFTGVVLKTVFYKLIADTLLFSPVYIVSFFWIQGTLNSLPEGSWLTELRDRGWQCWLAEAVLWGPIQFVNFRFLSTRYRIAFDASVSFLFDMYYSFTYNKKIS